MKKRRLPEPEFKVNMTPMIDVVFQLMIFFMCTIEFKTLDAKLEAYLPKDAGPGPSTEQIETVDITVLVLEEGTKIDPIAQAPWRGEGPFRFGSDRVVHYRVASKVMLDLASLKQRLRVLHAAEPERKVTIAPGAGAVYNDLVQVLDSAVAAGFVDITFKRAR